MAGDAEYCLTRDYLDNNRINLQHYQWISLFGYLLHPSIPIDDPTLKVADVGTGTAIWLTELANQLPKSASLVAVDISFEAAPPKQMLPENIDICHWNVRDKVPESLLGAFDVVHIRNFSFVLRDEEILGVLKRLIQLLKPNGALQWGETDVASFRIEKMAEGAKTDALTQLLKVSQGQDARFSPTWVTKLPALFAEENLVDITTDVRNAPPHLAFPMHENNLIVHELLVRQTKNESVAKELPKLMPEVLRETRQGCYWAFTRWCVMAKRT